jgi:hypothetical protein
LAEPALRRLPISNFRRFNVLGFLTARARARGGLGRGVKVAKNRGIWRKTADYCVVAQMTPAAVILLCIPAPWQKRLHPKQYRAPRIAEKFRRMNAL